MNAEQIRARFIEDNAERLMSELKGVLDGTGEFSSKSGIWLGYAFERIKSMVDASDDLKLVKATNTKEILTAVTKGKITVTEAKELMVLLKLQADIEGASGDDLDNLGTVEFLIRKKGKNE